MFQSKRKISVKKISTIKIPAVIFPGLFLSLLFLTFISSASNYKNIISTVVNAPVVSNGLVAGEPTEFNIILNARKSASRFDLDPRNRGYQIPHGGKMVIRLGGTYKRNPNFMSTITGVNRLAANANIILTIAPQNPIVSTAGTGVQHGNWVVNDNGKRKIIISPVGNKLENRRARRIGVKVVHIRPNPRDIRLTLDRAPFINGPAGTVGRIRIKIFNEYGVKIKEGHAQVIFRKNPGPQVHISNAGLTTGSQGSPATTTAELFESVHYQRVPAHTLLVNTVKMIPFSSGLPYAPRFLLFAGTAQQPSSFIPQLGIENVGYYTVEDRKAIIVVDSNANGQADIGDKKIGVIRLLSPQDSLGSRILDNASLTSLSGNGSIFNVPIKAGDTKGAYRLKVRLFGGGSAKTVIFVE